MTVFATVVVMLAATLARQPEWQLSMRVNPLGVRTLASRTGSSRFGWDYDGVGTLSVSRSRVARRTAAWAVDLRVRGPAEEWPVEAEVKAYYIGCEGESTVPQVFGEETRTAVFDVGGKARVELKSPECVQTRTQRRTGNVPRHGWGFSNLNSRSRKTGRRILGVVVQVFVKGELMKSYASDSRWQAAAKEVPFTQGGLVKRRRNALQ